MKDLFRFVNGQWLDTYEIPADRPMDGNFYVLRDRSEERMHEIVRQSPGPGGRMFRSFMDKQAIDELGIRPLEEDFAKIHAVTTVADLCELFGYYDRHGVTGGPVGFYVGKSADSEDMIAYLLQSGLGLPDEAYYREPMHAETLQQYRDHLERMLGFVPAEYLPVSAGEAADRIVALETELAQGHWDVVASRDAVKTFNPREFSELDEHVRIMLTAGGVTGGRLIVCQPSYLEHLAGVLSAERLEDFKLQLLAGVVIGSAPLLSEEITEANFDFFGRTLSGVEQMRDRWKRGVAFAESVAGEDLGREYAAKYFPPEHKQQMVELVDYLIAAYRERISNLAWMTPATRDKALEKLGKFKAKIGYPDKWRDYSALELSEGGEHALHNMRVAAAFNHDYEVAKLGRPADRDQWHMMPQTVNACYDPVVNDITFPAAILQWPFFDPDADAAENFGAIGAVIGHEIGHGFDDQGSQYDGDGLLKSWWTEEDRASFEALTAKLVDQFQGLVPQVVKEAGIETTGVNGAFTLGENIGDLGGLGIAVVAYRRYLEDRGLTFATAPVSTTDADGASEGVEGTEFTGLQRLFIAWARVWRTKARPQMAVQLLAVDPHSPAEFRCNVIAANVEEFYQAFEVEEGSACWVAPQDRVTIW